MISTFIMCAWAVVLTDPGQCNAQQRPQRYPYAVFELPTLGGGYSYGWALDDRGHALGAAYGLGNSHFHATVWTDAGLPKDIGTLGGGDSEAFGMNRNGWIVGRAQVKGQMYFDFSAFLWHDGRMYNLGYLGGDFAEAYGINDHNQIVGWATLDNTPERPEHGFLWDHGVMTDLGTLDGTGSEAIAINNSGLIVGQAWSDTTTTWRAVIWENGKIRDLGTFREDNGGQGICIDVNEAGDVVGYVDYHYHQYQAFLYHNDVMYPLPMMDNWDDSYAWSINDHGEIVGAGRTIDNQVDDIGVIWKRHEPVRYLVDLIPPNSNWYIGPTIHNNNLGQITGWGYRLDDPDKHDVGYLITPIHQTIRLSRAQPGTAGAVNTLKVYGATPGAQVTFIYGDKGGGSAIPGCTLEQNALQIDSPIVLATITANANGVAALRGYVPSGAQGRTVLIQAFVQGECGVSQLVVQRFE